MGQDIIHQLRRLKTHANALGSNRNFCDLKPELTRFLLNELVRNKKKLDEGVYIRVFCLI